ncbi:molybdate ABC transporter permease subunit [Nocardioides seonyuensis]|uniref:Molybdenum transport system permease n=1 Tax=Nocardioides seonyuensis TaxID=2518371 RepID=A0A4P7IJ55_9ACTN|nr:molybdate ABC transporter permease subunit [Nocardioides seonyuensis]
MSTARLGSVRLGRAPLLLVVPAVCGVALLVVPLLTLVLDTPWRTLPEHLGSEPVRQALGITAVSSLLTVAVCVVIGTPLAWLLACVDFRGRRVVRSLVLVPLVLPPVVAGVALVTALGRSGLVGQHLPFSVPYTTAGVVLAHTFVSLPFYVLAVEGALRTRGAAYDVVAATLGADRWTTFRRVTLPLALPGILAGSALAWARSLGEFGATITFAGNYPGSTQTMPSLIYVALGSDPMVARTLSLILLVLSVAVLVLLRERWATR